MAAPKRIAKDISLDQVYLHHENPRHERYESQSEVIDYLCSNESVLPLARDIVQHGLNPLERFAVFRDDTGDDENKPAFIVGEGNRRVCAIKLLADPDLAPPRLRQSIENLAVDWNGLETIPAVVFHDMDDLDLWLDRIHQGPQGGVGRKEWNADQKQRHSGSSKNRIALALLDYAEHRSFISSEDRKGKLTTVQRYASNKVFQETLGIDSSKPDEVCRNRTEEDFNLLLRRFIADLQNQPGDVNSRSNSPQIEEYARKLGTTAGQSHDRIDPESVQASSTKSKTQRRQKTTKLKKPTKLPYDSEIAAKLIVLNSYKLQNLYNSVCSIRFTDHTPLLAIGTWAFFESLSAKAGREDGASFPSFFSKSRLQRYGLGAGRKTKPINEAITRISEFGNTTKHHETAAAFNGEQLSNDLETLREVIVKCADEAISKMS